MQADPLEGFVRSRLGRTGRLKLSTASVCSHSSAGTHDRLQSLSNNMDVCRHVAVYVNKHDTIDLIIYSSVDLQ